MARLIAWHVRQWTKVAGLRGATARVHLALKHGRRARVESVLTTETWQVRASTVRAKESAETGQPQRSGGTKGERTRLTGTKSQPG